MFSSCEPSDQAESNRCDEMTCTSDAQCYSNQCFESVCTSEGVIDLQLIVILVSLGIVIVCILALVLICHRVSKGKTNLGDTSNK